MGKERTTVEVGLIERDDKRVKDWLKESELDLYSFDAEVISVSTSLLGYRVLNVLYPIEGGYTTRTIALEKYWILSSTCMLTGMAGPVSDIWALENYEQLEAFNLFQDALQEAAEEKQLNLLGLTEGGTVVGSRPNGPKRLEVEMQSSGIREKVVVTDALASAGAWKNPSLRGRVWLNGRLSKGISSMHAPGWQIFRIDTILGANLGSSTSHYSSTSQDQSRAWTSVVEAWGKYDKSEIDNIKGWEPKVATGDSDDDDLDELYPGFSSASADNEHWTNRSPAHYQQYVAEPISSYSRVRGDNEGREIFCEQSKALGEPMDMFEVLEYMEKKDEAADKDESDTTAESNTENSARDSNAASSMGDSSFCTCVGTEDCDICLAEEAGLGYGFGHGFGGIMH